MRGGIWGTILVFIDDQAVYWVGFVDGKNRARAVVPAPYNATRKHSMKRRDFLSGLAAAVACGPRVLAQSKRAKAPLASPAFYWGVGIENCWMAQTDPTRDGNRRLLDVFSQMQHYEKWKADLDLAAEVGVNAIRYSVPWYKAEPTPGVYDWSWIDGPIEYLVEKLGIIPIMDLIHYGTPTWMPDGVIDPRFPEAIAKYSEAMASHFRGLVNHYSPHNEPQLTCLFCGMTGRWPPYQKSVESWAKIGIQVARGMVLQTRAIRGAISDAVIMSVDPWLDGVIDPFLPEDLTDANRPILRDAAAVYPASLAYGKIDADHPLAEFLVDQGIKAEDIDWLKRHAELPDIVGCNYYPDIFAFGDQGDFTRKGALPLEQAAREAADLLAGAIRRAHDYFKLPVCVTETSAGLANEAKVAYIEAVAAMADRLRAQQVPLTGLVWWPLFDTIQWDYREKVDKPLKDFIYPGGWNNGLYGIDVQADGDLKRVRTPAAEAYRKVIGRDKAR